MSPNISEQEEDVASKPAVTSFDQIQVKLPRGNFGLPGAKF